MTARHLLTAGAAIGGAYGVVYRLGRTWGASRDEQRRVMPGDELITGPRLRTTHAITIAAPRWSVWPWLVQMGWGRAGWYTYRWVDVLLFPANQPSATGLLPEHQHLAVGDRVPDGPPDSGCAFTVVRVEPPSLLVLHSDSHLFGTLAERDDVAMDWAWTWQLEGLPGERTRVVVRNNGRLRPPWLHAAYLATIVPADLLMARSHLRGLRDRAESTIATSAAGTRV